jgi:hypothetical protein
MPQGRFLPTYPQCPACQPLNGLVRIGSARQRQKYFTSNPEDWYVIDGRADEIPMFLECPNDIGRIENLAQRLDPPLHCCELFWKIKALASVKAATLAAVSRRRPSIFFFTRWRPDT